MPKHGRFPHPAESLSDVRHHAIMNTVIVLAIASRLFDLGIRNDVAGCACRLGILCVNASAAEHIWLAARELPRVDA
jgi:hypothetical protein